MAQPINVSTSGDYTANLLGNISSHLAGLQGYAVMALELIQNADDAKASEIIFDVTKDGLVVTNSGTFSYCGDLKNRPCSRSKDGGSQCDFHRIADVGSGGKLSSSDNIGRFGIGFVSTYQITDHPEIRSSGIKLTLRPEDGQWTIVPHEEPCGTSFFLPWAKDPESRVRLGLRVSHVTQVHIDQLVEDFKRVLRSSLLFLRHVTKADVRHNGKLIFGCDLLRGEGELIVTFRPDDTVEQWHILRADAAEAAQKLCTVHPRLAKLNRSTRVAIGLRLDPEPLQDGFLYAFLPTEQSVGLPLHINADFFPEADRKAVIFDGHQHEQVWNEMLIDAAARALAQSPEGLVKILGHVGTWQLLTRAYDLNRSPNRPACFKKFWERLKLTCASAPIALVADGRSYPPGAVLIPRSTTFGKIQEKALREIDGLAVAESLRAHQNVMTQLGAVILTAERVVALLERATAEVKAGSDKVEKDRIEAFYIPLWGMLNELLPEVPSTPRQPWQAKLTQLPFVLSEDLYVVSIGQSYATPPGISSAKAASLFPRLSIVSQHLAQYARLLRLVDLLSLERLTRQLESDLEGDDAEESIKTDEKSLRDLYGFLTDLDRAAPSQKATYDALRALPIWQSGGQLISASHALLPGNFKDPTGSAELLDVTILNEATKTFLTGRLGVEILTIESYVLTVLHRFFTENGPKDPTKYARLVKELSGHRTLVDNEHVRSVLMKLPMVPTQDGGWAPASKTYWRSSELERVLGNALHHWIDGLRVPAVTSVRGFIQMLGVRETPSAEHLVGRILQLAEDGPPTDDARRASAQAFYFLCDRFEDWRYDPAFQEALNEFRDVECFPADGDGENWYSADELHAPYRPDAFKSQADILDFKNTNRLKTDLLDLLGITLEPATQLVVNHLRHCMENKLQPSTLVYQVLSERAVKNDVLIGSLAGTYCIYVKELKMFLRPNQVYWTRPHLGRYAYLIPPELESYKPFFAAIGVKDAPGPRDLIDILLDIVEEHYTQSRPVMGPARSVYDVCLAGIATTHSAGNLEGADIARLEQAPIVVNMKHLLTMPDEVLLHDSEWHANFFEGELDAGLCRLPVELWRLLEDIGVDRLSESTKTELEFFDGPRNNEFQIAEKLRERKDIVQRMLHDKPSKARARLREAVERMEVVSYDELTIQASVELGNSTVSASPAPANAFFDLNDYLLYLRRPLSDRTWPHILNSIFHQLFPGEAGSEIGKLTVSVRSMIGRSVDDAHQELDDAGFPPLDQPVQQALEDLESPELGSMGEELSDGSHEATEDEVAPDKSRGDTVDADSNAADLYSDLDPYPDDEDDHHGVVESGSGSVASGNSGRTTGVNGEGGSDVSSSASGNGKKRRGGSKVSGDHKEQWNRRMLSYVRQRESDGAIGAERDYSSSERNMEVEAFARKAVCIYEKLRGRAPEQMPQTHPGYDVISRTAQGALRYIEIKGIDGEWNLTGAGLSKLQFSNAQNYSNQYWLYVVEHAMDPERTHIYPIQSPATKVDYFMFDTRWREVADEEKADPALAYAPHTQVRHQTYGTGAVKAIVTKGGTVYLSIDFEQQGLRTLPLDTSVIQIIDEPDE